MIEFDASEVKKAELTDVIEHYLTRVIRQYVKALWINTN
jgi:hypothetical protein